MGSVNIDNTGSGADVTLSSDGTSLLLDGTAIGGGGGADLYAANEVSVTAQPSATGDDAIAIGDSAVASGANALAGPFSQASGANSFAAAIGSTSTSWGAKADYGVALGFEARVETGATYGAAVGYSADSRASFGVAIGPDAYVTTNGTRAIAIGYQAEAGAAQSFAAGDAAIISSSGTSAVALGTSYANGTDSFAAAIALNSSTYGALSGNSVAIGKYAKSNNSNGVAIGNGSLASGLSAVTLGISSLASGTFGTSVGYQTQATAGNSVAVGRGCVASGSQSTALGYQSQASGEYSTAIGRNAKAELIGKFAYAAADFGAGSFYSQTGIYVFLADTTDATAEALTTNNSTASTTNQIILPNNSAYAFHGTIVARQQASGGTASAAWKIEGLIRREANAGTTTLVNSATTVLDNTPSWGMALSADTTNGGLKIEVTGAAATNIRWVATIHTSEVTYA
jgi:hypothetical protein